MKKWSDVELLLIEKVIKGEMFPCQVAFKTGRTEKSIQRRVHRRIREKIAELGCKE